MESSPLGTFEDPRPYDILCGRNRNSFNNIGNRRFRITINMNVEKYNSMRSRHERSKFIASLAHTMKYEVGFRFLKRGKNPSETSELTDDEVRAKIGHALRDLSTVLRGEEEEDQEEDQQQEQKSLDSKVPRPGPYKKSDKTALSCALGDKVTSCSVPLIPNNDINITSMASPQEPSAKPDPVRSCSTPPPTQEPNTQQVLLQDTKTPLKSNKKTLQDKLELQDLKLFPLEVGQQSSSFQLSCSSFQLQDDDDEYYDEDEYWTHAELERERSNRSQRTAMSVGTFDLQQQHSNRSQRTFCSVGTFDMSLDSSCISDGLETLSLVST